MAASDKYELLTSLELGGDVHRPGDVVTGKQLEVAGQSADQVAKLVSQKVLKQSK